jgi:hypothetical protein
VRGILGTVENRGPQINNKVECPHLFFAHYSWMSYSTRNVGPFTVITKKEFEHIKATSVIGWNPGILATKSNKFEPTSSDGWELVHIL